MMPATRRRNSCNPSYTFDDKLIVSFMNTPAFTSGIMLVKAAPRCTKSCLHFIRGCRYLLNCISVGIQRHLVADLVEADA